MKNNKVCKYCGAGLKKDWIALNKKLLDADAREYLCLHCLADDFECDIDDLIIKIIEFKENGCTFFK